MGSGRWLGDMRVWIVWGTHPLWGSTHSFLGDLASLGG